MEGFPFRKPTERRRGVLNNCKRAPMQSSKIPTACCLTWMTVCINQTLISWQWARIGRGVSVEITRNGKSMKQQKKRKNITVFNISHHLFACDMSVLLWHWLMDQQQRKHNWPTDRLYNIFFIQPASDSRCSLQSEAAYVLPTDSTHYCRWTIHFQSPSCYIVRCEIQELSKYMAIKLCFIPIHSWWRV